MPLEYRNGRKKEESKYSIPILLDMPLNSHFAESFRTLATNVRFTQVDHPKGVYLVTSSMPGEGKSTLTLNLGITMPQLGMSTLVLEADLRVPSVKNSLDIQAQEGITEVLLDMVSTEVKDGVLGELTITDLHKLLELQEKTGEIRYDGGADSFSVLFHKGRIIDVDWLTRPPETGFGQLLVKSGKLTPEQLEIVVQKKQATHQRFATVVLNLGFCSVEELAGPLKLHIQENIEKLYGCGNARFRFVESPSGVSLSIDEKDAAIRTALGNIETELERTPKYLMDIIQRRITRIPGTEMSLLLCGKKPANPAELLASKRMRVLVDLLRRQFDLILIDSPPVGTVSDAAILSSLADGVILVIKALDTNHGTIARAKEQLDTVDAPMVGAVLNMLDYRKEGYYYYGKYYHKYRRYYTE